MSSRAEDGAQHVERMDVAAVRAEIEARYLRRPEHAMTEGHLVGTVVIDDPTLVVVLRERATGELHRIVTTSGAGVASSPSATPALDR